MLKLIRMILIVIVSLTILGCNPVKPRCDKPVYHKMGNGSIRIGSTIGSTIYYTYSLGGEPPNPDSSGYIFEDSIDLEFDHVSKEPLMNILMA